MPDEQGTQQRKTDDIWPKDDVMPYVTGVRCVVAVYVGGLLASLIAGGTAPQLFINKQAVLSPPGGISSASSDFVFDMSGYKVIATPIDAQILMLLSRLRSSWGVTVSIG